jgi:hypothetical protein
MRLCLFFVNQVVRVGMDFGDVIMGHALGPAVIVPVALLDAVQRRLEAATSLLELDGRRQS